MRPTRKVKRLLALCGAWSCLAAGCATTREGEDSETHFLCSTDADCVEHGSDYRCIERKCSRAADAALEALPSSCEDISGGAPAQCNSLLSRQCEQVQADTSDRRYWFTLSLSYPPSGLTCVVAALEALGLDPVAGVDNVSVSASFSAVEPLLRLPPVSSYWVDCTQAGCPHCDGLPTDECAADAFCAVIGGSRWNEAGLCYEPAEPVGCYELRLGCGPAGTFARDPSGACWMFGSTCQPAGWLSLEGEQCGPAGSLVQECPGRDAG